MGHGTQSASDGGGDPMAVVLDSPIKTVLRHRSVEIGLEVLPGESRFSKMLVGFGYGHIRKHIGADGEALDVYVHEDIINDPEKEDYKVYRLEQLTESGDFDEYKFFLGWKDAVSARLAYESAISPERAGLIEDMDWEDLGDYRTDAKKEKKSRRSGNKVWVEDPSVKGGGYWRKLPKGGVSLDKDEDDQDGDRYEKMTIRQLQEEASGRGVYRSHGQKASELRRQLRVLDQDPEVLENTRRTLQGLRKTKTTALRVLPKGVSRDWRQLERVAKAVKGINPGSAALVVSAAIMGVTKSQFDQARDHWREGLPDSAAAALGRARKVDTEFTFKDNVTFAVGGFNSTGSSGQKIQQMLENPLDKSKEERWFASNNLIVPVRHPDFDIESSVHHKKLDDGSYNPLYLGDVVSKSLGKYGENALRGRNDAAVNLAANMWAYGRRYPDKPLNVVAHGAGGQVTDEAMEILSKMRERVGSAVMSGEKMRERISITRLGSPHFGFADSRWWREVNHRTITSKEDPFSILPNRAAQWVSRLRGGEVEDYLRSPDVREKLRENMGFYEDSLTGLTRSQKRNNQWTSALKMLSPTSGAFWGQLSAAGDMMAQNPALATVSALSVVAGTTAEVNRRAKRAYDENLDRAAREAVGRYERDWADRPAAIANLNPRGRDNLTLVMGGNWEDTSKFIEALPEEIRGTLNDKGGYTGGATGVINLDNAYGIRGNDPPPFINEDLKKNAPAIYHGLKSIHTFGSAAGEILNLGLFRELPFAEKGVKATYDPESIQIAAMLYALGKDFKYDRPNTNYAINIIANGEAGLKMRTALDILERMDKDFRRGQNLGGRDIMKHIKLVTIATPDLGISRDHLEEIAVVGTDDPVSLMPHRPDARKLQGVGAGYENYLSNPDFISLLMRELYSKKTYPNKVK